MAAPLFNMKNNKFNMTVLVILSFVGSILSLTFLDGFAVGKYTTLACVLFGFGVYLYQQSRVDWGRSDSRSEHQGNGERMPEQESLYEKIHALKVEIESHQKLSEQHSHIIDKLSEKCVCSSKGSDITQKLTKIVQEKTEESTLSFTQRVYRVLEISEQLNSTIQQVVGALSSEKEGSLSQDVRLLEQEQREIETLIKDFVDIRDGYSSEAERIKGDMRAIGEFVGAISDLADRTNVLAINASIEAARAGRAGDGFAVIGTEIQKLSKNSKQIADQIRDTIQNSVTAVSDSVEQYSEKINSAVGRLEQGGQTYAALISKLNPQIDELSRIVGTSDELSSQVHENVDEITVELQYQDRIKQILDHLLQILREIGSDAQSTVSECGQWPEADEQQLYIEMVRQASQHFSCDEEFEAFGLDNQEERERDETEFAGDVELF